MRPSATWRISLTSRFFSAPDIAATACGSNEDKSSRSMTVFWRRSQTMTRRKEGTAVQMATFLA
jgi:hypothetical protein